MPNVVSEFDVERWTFLPLSGRLLLRQAMKSAQSPD